MWYASPEAAALLAYVDFSDITEPISFNLKFHEKTLCAY